MKTCLQTIAALVLTAAAFTANAQTPLPYTTGFDNVAERTSWTEYRKGDPGFYQWQYSAGAYSTPTCLVHSYPVGGTMTTRDWFVSPGFSFVSGGSIDSLRYAFNGFGVPGNNDTVAIYLLNGSPDPSLATQTLLKDFRGADYVADNAWRKLSAVAIPATPGTSYIAFRYVTVANWLNIKLDNLSISAPPAAAFSATPGTACKGEPIALKDLSVNGPTSWNWQMPGGTPASSTASAVNVSYATAGIYTVSFSSTNGAGTSATVTKTVQVSECTGISEQNNVTAISFYPNPCPKGTALNIGLSGDYAGLTVRIHNVLGELVYEKALSGTAQNTTIELAPGTYVYSVRQNELPVKTGKLIVE